MLSFDAYTGIPNYPHLLTPKLYSDPVVVKTKVWASPQATYIICFPYNYLISYGSGSYAISSASLGK